MGSGSRLKTFAIWIALVLVLLLGFTVLGEKEDLERLEFAEFTADVQAAQVAEVRVDGYALDVELWDGREYTTTGAVDEVLIEQLVAQGVQLHWGEEYRPLRTVLWIALPLLAVVALFLFLLRRAQGGTANILSLRRSPARMIEGEGKVTFADVGGCEDAKVQLRDLIDFLDDPAPWQKAGVRLPRGVLLEGPPGCGKTLLARAVAGETGASFFLVSASEFVEMFVGVGAARVRDTFERAAKKAPAVIFIDEIDAVGRRRGSGIGAAHDEREQTLNQILVCLDGFQHHDRVVVIAATNRSDVLDAALLRPGRFDRRIELPTLTQAQRAEVLAIHCRTKTLADDFTLDEIAERCANASGAHLESLANEAGLLAVRRLRREGGGTAVVTRDDFGSAIGSHAPESRRFDLLDALLVESTTQLAQPIGKVRVRITLDEGAIVEGEVVWADASFIKVRGDAGAEGAVVGKARIKTLEALDGTEWVSSDDVSPDRWAGLTPDLA